ncbi:sporulation histidine kinase inhibitor Sda [Virgibacillus oceani]
MLSSYLTKNRSITFSFLSDKQLLEAYNKALKLKLHNDFIFMLKMEINNRNIKIKKEC